MAEIVERIYKNGRAYVHNPITNELVRVDKMVYMMFVEPGIDMNDGSWEIGYKDGNYKNCAADNLYKIIKE